MRLHTYVSAAGRPRAARFHLGALRQACRTSATRTEGVLLIALALATWLALGLPATALPADYHHFADQRAWLGLPHAMDVLTNLPFAAAGIWGLVWLRRVPTVRLGLAQRALAALFLIGLVATAMCSGAYHLAPDHGGLCIDRLGMGLPFAGLIGLAVADRVSARAGVVSAVFIGLAAPAAALWDWASGNMTPWALLQGGGLVLLAALALRRPRAGALGFSILAVMAFYAVAKGLELADHPIFTLTQGWLSGHSAKHPVAALAAWPVVRALQRRAGAAARPGPALTIR